MRTYLLLLVIALRYYSPNICADEAAPYGTVALQFTTAEQTDLIVLFAGAEPVAFLYYSLTIGYMAN